MRHHIIHSFNGTIGKSWKSPFFYNITGRITHCQLHMRIQIMISNHTLSQHFNIITFKLITIDILFDKNI